MAVSVQQFCNNSSFKYFAQMYSEEGITVCNTGGRSRTFYVEHLHCSAWNSAGKLLLHRALTCTLLPLIWYFCPSQYSVVAGGIVISGKIFVNSKLLRVSTMTFNLLLGRRMGTGKVLLLLQANWEFESEQVGSGYPWITGLMPSMHHLWACLFPAGSAVAVWHRPVFGRPLNLWGL